MKKIVFTSICNIQQYNLKNVFVASQEVWVLSSHLHKGMNFIPLSFFSKSFVNKINFFIIIG